MKVGIISVTLNATNPITEFLRENNKNIEVMNYLDEGLIKQVRKEKSVTINSMRRMELIVKKAKNDGANIILLTCTVFSPYAKIYEKVVGIPVIAADEAMFELVYKKNKKTIVLCTFEPTIKTTADLIHRMGKDLNKSLNYKLVLVEGAYSAIQQGNHEEHDRLIEKKINDLAKECELIVLAQMSMSKIGKQVDLPVEVLTSPSCAALRLEGGEKWEN